MRLLAFAASNSAVSINHQFANWAARQHSAAQVETLRIHDYELPIFSPEREAQLGHPALAREFLARLRKADGLVIAYAEHNGGFTAAWKNLSDWVSRIERRYLSDKPVLLLSSSPGAGGAARVLEQARDQATSARAQIVDAVSLPNFPRPLDALTGQIDNPAVEARVREALRRMHQQVCGAAAERSTGRVGREAGAVKTQARG